mgnify:CR=1 FL=1
MGDAVEENAHQQYGERGARGGKEGSAETDNADAAQAFLDWAVSDEDALKIWQEWGFELA